MGTPAVVFATTDFETLCRSVAGQLAPPEAAIVVVPHPLGGTAEEVVRGWGAAACEEVMDALLAGS